MIHLRYSSVAACSLALSVLTAPALAQQPDSVRRDTTVAPPAPPPPKPARTPDLNFSGVIFLNWNYRTDQTARAQNRFDVERAYLNFRMPVGDRSSIRITTDVYQNSTAPNDAYYRGWAIRAKYAYFQYDYLRDYRGVSAWARAGMLNTIVIEHIETFWPRWIGRTADELSGFFLSADMGVATEFTFPSDKAELYLTVTNGPGYTSREVDRFKDAAVRLTITPLAGSKGFFSTASLTAWGYKGAIASRFVAGGAGQIGPVGESLQRDRWGLFAGLRDRRLTIGTEFAQRIDEGEIGSNTTVSPRVVIDSTGTLFSGFAIVRPFEWIDPSRRSPIALLGRYDRFRFNDEAGPASRQIIAGVIYDLDRRLSIAGDFQQTLPRDGAPGTALKTWFIHAIASF